MKFVNENNQIAYVGEKESEALAYLKYSVIEDGKVLSVDSTFVDPSLRGQGIAHQLVDELADYARKNDYKIKPECSYVVDLFERSDEYQDVAY